jgi:hypothetical protein
MRWIDCMMQRKSDACMTMSGCARCLAVKMTSSKMRYRRFLGVRFDHIADFYATRVQGFGERTRSGPSSNVAALRYILMISVLISATLRKRFLTTPGEVVRTLSMTSKTLVGNNMVEKVRHDSFVVSRQILVSSDYNFRPSGFFVPVNVTR